jgi:hypothetical protein
LSCLGNKFPELLESGTCMVCAKLCACAGGQLTCESHLRQRRRVAAHSVEETRVKLDREQGASAPPPAPQTAPQSLVMQTRATLLQ